ncbi:DinB family protein [Candidatus Acetothermia bacterium]|nr:DinB family protein [Candidatus Acetothermia bacterium]MBI3643648.1 DinB family protein [Candidatus Acetothermia bacterium]
MTTLQETIDQAKANFLQAKESIKHALATTPDDRINWSPSPTARTPIEQVAHSAWAIKSIHDMLDGRPLQTKETAEADRDFREWEKQFRTREQVLSLLDQNGAAYLKWLDALTPERLATQVKAPFGLGSVPMSLALTFVPYQIRVHAHQIDYIQTIYGDRDWHM